MIMNRNFHFTIVEWNAFHSTVSRAYLYYTFCTIPRLVFYCISSATIMHDRNAIVTYLTAIVCNCHIVTDGIELKYTICAKQNGGCNNIFKVFNDNIS